MKLYLLTYANLSAFIVRAKDENAARSLIEEKYGENKVVIEERETYNLLVTSFYLEKDHQVKKKLKKFNDYVQMQRTPF